VVLEQLGVLGYSYSIPAAFRLQGSLDVGALERSVGTLIERHESLRTRIESRDGIPYQVIAEPGDYRLDQEDLTLLGPVEREARLEEVMQQERMHRFDLSAGPLLRVLLLKLAAQDHVLLLTMHHIVSDGWSLGILIRELSVLYAAYGRGEHSPLEPLEVQYADYAIWQRQWLQGEVLEKQLSYWRERLSGTLPVLELPTDRQRPAVASFKGAVHSFALSKELSAGLQELRGARG